MLALLAIFIVPSMSGYVVAAITTSDALVEATHTTLPGTIGESDQESISDRTGDLREAATKESTQRLEIIKHIRKVNQDGSYTVGYEAEDGTFKIESRDVLGNIKGTYGYIDLNGDIKRVSYGGQPSRTIPMAATQSTPEEEIVHIPPRLNRSQILAPTTRRPPNYHPSQQLHLNHLNPQHHSSTLRPSVIQTIPRKRHGYSSSSTTPATRIVINGTTTVVSGGISMSAMMTSTTTTESTVTATSTETSSGNLAASYGEPTAASTHTSSMHTKPGTLLIIRPTPLPYLAAKTAEQLVRPERLEVAKYAHATKKSIRGNFLRRQLGPTTSESGEQYEAQPQQIIYGHSVTDGDLGGIFTGSPKPLYTTHPTPRIPAAVLAARQRAAHIQNVLQSQSQATQSGPPERLTTERIYVKQPARPQAPTGNRQEKTPIVYETSTEPSSEHNYVTDGPTSTAVVQIPAANHVLAVNEAEPPVEERRPVFHPRPVEFRARDDSSSPTPARFRTPYGISPPYARPFTSLPPSPETTYSGRITPTHDIDANDTYEPHNHQHNSVSPYRQQRRLSGALHLPAPESLYQQQQPSTASQIQQQQQQHLFPNSIPYNVGQNAPHLVTNGRHYSNPYYYDIPAERPLTARDFERILQLLIFRHQQQQVSQQISRYRLGGDYTGSYNRAFMYNPYLSVSPSPFNFGEPYIGGGYPQQQIPRPPLPYPYPGDTFDGQGYQNPLYSQSVPSSSVRSGGHGSQSVTDVRYGNVLPSVARRNGQIYQSPLDVTAPSATTEPHRSADYLPPEVRERLLYRMLMLAIQAPGSGDAFPLTTPNGSSNQQLPLHHLQTASSIQQHQTQPSHQNQNLVQNRPNEQSMAPASAAATILPIYSKKPVRSVQILGEE
ncbi:uncharacterized protein LOC128729168 [Anopheles nili]|uniref:uncharacterized protein LOC128729168 n=1 Tax=Anopheles nili TaxID=185578 RepID=UPI00237AA1DF|nr:uncharacterized protein LOC128729168 [Anopheles nili]